MEISPQLRSFCRNIVADYRSIQFGLASGEQYGLLYPSVSSGHCECLRGSTTSIPTLRTNFSMKHTILSPQGQGIFNNAALPRPRIHFNYNHSRIQYQVRFDTTFRFHSAHWRYRLRRSSGFYPFYAPAVPHDNLTTSLDAIDEKICIPDKAVAIRKNGCRVPRKCRHYQQGNHRELGDTPPKNWPDLQTSN